ncbi:MAG: nitroreductase family protein [Oscillibacter sp.]
MDFKTLAAERYSLRKFSTRPVEKEKLALVLEAARSAPTALNLQPQHIFVMESPEALERISACTDANYHPPLMLVVAYDAAIAWTRELDGKNQGEIDAALVTAQVMLQAADLGLGTTFVGHFHPAQVVAAFPEMQGFTPIALLPIGYPAEGAHPSRLHGDRKPLESMVTVL